MLCRQVATFAAASTTLATAPRQCVLADRPANHLSGRRARVAPILTMADDADSDWRTCHGPCCLHRHGRAQMKFRLGLSSIVGGFVSLASPLSQVLPSAHGVTQTAGLINGCTRQLTYGANLSRSEAEQWIMLHFTAHRRVTQREKFSRDAVLQSNRSDPRLSSQWLSTIAHRGRSF